MKSYWERAALPAKNAVSAPIRPIKERPHEWFSKRGVVRISKNIPATTIVDLCRRADTGVGPSIADGSHG